MKRLHERGGSPVRLDDFGDVLRVSECAAICQLGKAKIYEMCATGRLRPLRAGTALRVPKSQIVKLLEEGL